MNNMTDQRKDYKKMTWEQLYDACTQKEREDMLFLMLGKIEKRQEEAQRESIEIYKRDPGLLTSLSVSALRELADRVAEEAHKKILHINPEIADLLLALECLTSFSMGKDEPINYNDLTDVIASLKDVWNSVSMETEVKPA